jgi:hypothetical protein
MTGDIVVDYLKAKLVGAKFDLFQSCNILIPEFYKNLDQNGLLLWNLITLLYGNIQAGKEWYFKLTDKLKSIFYFANSYYGQFIINKWFDEIKRLQNTIGIITCASSDEILENNILHHDLKNKEFINIVTGSDFNITYTGIIFDFLIISGRVYNISLRGCNYNWNEKINKLVTMEMTTSMYAFTVQYQTYQILKMIRYLLSFTNGFKDLFFVRLESMDESINSNVITDKFHHNVFHNCFMREIGDETSINYDSGMIKALSNKISINTKLNADTELVSDENYATPEINTPNIPFMKRVKAESVIFHQDNQSILAMIKNGKSTESTTQLQMNRYFWKDDDESFSTGNLMTEYVSVSNLQSDALSKPSKGNLFLWHRAKLLNLKD